MTSSLPQIQAILLDTEGTSNKNPEVIELGYITLTSPQELTILTEFNQRYKPAGKITLGALATHHILDEDLQDFPPADTAHLDVQYAPYMIGHNVDFDWNALGQPPVKRIDTLALARYVWPKIDSHTVGALTYFLSRDRARELLKNAHSALHDVYLTLPILKALIEQLQAAGELTDDCTWADIHAISDRARIPETMPFGKHYGVKLRELPQDYIRWALANMDNLDPYLRMGLERARA